MRSTAAALLAGVAFGAGLVGSAAVATANDALQQTAADPNAWAMNGRTYDNTRFSPLKQINTENVAASASPMPSSLARCGQRIHAARDRRHHVRLHLLGAKIRLCARCGDGRAKWKYEPDIPDDVLQFACCDVNSRGVTYADGKIFVGRLDGTLVGARRQDRQGTLDGRGGRLQAGLGDHLAAAGGEEQGHHRLRRRRIRRPRQPAGLRHQHRQAGLEDLDRAGPGRGRQRDLEGRFLAAWRRRRLAGRLLRRQDQHGVLGHQQSRPVERRRAQHRHRRLRQADQPVHRQHAGARCRYRQDQVARAGHPGRRLGL